ncbi:sensor histidine kinase [Erythrobacter sp. JK5]|uniref:sensor histidine kinase n=1 Tax=Erythrobacter sp. JK5 TaxID=2829500 RepID=UPI002738BD21|nr:HWE histidine kinase domain-containing protein [Erythrobacter sp. JK5]
MTLFEQKPWPVEAPPAQEYCDEEQRLRVLSSFGFASLGSDPELDRITRFAARLCNAESAAVSLVESERQVFLARERIELTETPRSTSFCAHTMLGSEILEVLDATDDDRFSGFAMVTGEAHLRYYAGVPLISSEGAPLGALCVLDTEPRSTGLSEVQIEGLITLAEAVRRRIETHRYANRASEEIQASAERLQFMLDSVPDIAWSAAPGPTWDYFNARFGEVTGKSALHGIDDWREVIHPEDFEASLVKFSHALETASPFEDEWRLKQADGSYRWIISRAVPSSNDPATARWFGTLTDIDDRYRISQERELLAGELAHRIKNIFAVISGLISMTARGDASLQTYAGKLTDTVRALSQAQEAALKTGSNSGGNLRELLAILTAPYGSAVTDSVRIDGDAVTFGSRSATPLALVFHELATNSAKYGALSTPEGTVDIAISRGEEDVRIDWRESGGPPAVAPEQTGFGSRLVTLAIGNQLGGNMVQNWHAEGLHAEITLSLERLAQ